MGKWAVALAAVVFASISAQAQLGVTAPSRYVPPNTQKQATFDALPASTASRLVENNTNYHQFTNFAGLNKALSSVYSSEVPPRVGLHTDEVVPAEVLFSQSQQEGGYTTWTASISSQDANAIRLQVDLSRLGFEDEVFVISPRTNVSFGPYTLADAVEGGNWLTVVEGDAALLAIRSKSDTRPQVDLLNVSHFFENLRDIAAEQGTMLKQLECQINVACEENELVQLLKTGVGLMFFPAGGGTSACTGTLINNPLTEELEPYFITAYHCVSEQSQARGTDVIWDFESSTCEVDTVPSLDTLPRSRGECVLTTNGTLDASLLALRSVADAGGSYGAYGRFFSGWSTEPVQTGEFVFGIHHPAASHKRFSEGDVVGTNQTIVLGDGTVWQEQITVEWTRGLTEGGSSGSGLFRFTEADCALVGMLSNGPAFQTCDDIPLPSGYANFESFFSQAAPWLFFEDPPACGENVVGLFETQNFRALPRADSNAIRLSWRLPTDLPIQEVQIVRKQASFPRGPDDGVTISTVPSFVNEFIDSNPGAPGDEVFYGIFPRLEGAKNTTKASVGNLPGTFTRAVVGNPVPQSLTESFPEESDLSFTQITFSPVGDLARGFDSLNPNAFFLLDNYTTTIKRNVFELPVERQDAVPLDLRRREMVRINPAFVQQSIPFFGRLLSDFIVSASGFITTTESSVVTALQNDPNLRIPGLDNHWDIPRISFLFGDLSPNSRGDVWARSMKDRIVVTFESVPRHNTFPPQSNTVQCEIFYSGHIRMTYLDVNIRGAVVGLSDGRGLPLSPVDLSPLIVDFTQAPETNQRLTLDPIPIQIANEEDLVAFTATANGSTGQPISFSAEDLPLGAQFDSTTGLFFWRTNTRSSGAFAPLIRASQSVDPVGSEILTAEQRVLILVNDVNLKPVASNVRIIPGEIAEGDAFRVEYDYSHPQNVPEGITDIIWTRNSFLVNALFSTQIVPETAAKEGDEWSVAIVPRTIRGVQGDPGFSDSVIIGQVTEADINQDGKINAVDVQLVINAALGKATGGFNSDANRDGETNAVDVQLVINKALN